MAMVARKIVKIDEDKCDGCGACIPSCAEGAIRIVDGKARLVAENLCDGIGNCLGECPRGAITIEQREADKFDEQAVKVHLSEAQSVIVDEPAGFTCPGMAMRKLEVTADGPAGSGGAQPSRLGHWPVQIALLPERAEMWRDADMLVAADCVACAMGDFHERLLAGKTLAIACPKLDDVQPYVEKLAAIFANNDVKSITVAHMDVPCCSGLLHVVRAALELSGRDDIVLSGVTVGIDGTLRDDQES